jgi:NADH-quinone oxidoreductase subunit A
MYRFDMLILISSLVLLFLLVIILLGLSFLLSPRNKTVEKFLPYECGFNPFEDTRAPFEVHFYLVALIFLIFDLEVAFIMPWMLVYDTLGFAGFWLVSLFLFLLVLGFCYEIFVGALDWDN